MTVQGSLPYFIKTLKSSYSCRLRESLLRMQNLIGMCAFCLNRWYRTWVSRAIPWWECCTDTKDTQLAFGNSIVPPGNAFDIIAQYAPATCHRKYQGLGTSKIHLTAHPRKGTLLFLQMSNCYFFLFPFSSPFESELSKNLKGIISFSTHPYLPFDFLNPSV